MCPKLKISNSVILAGGMSSRIQKDGPPGPKCMLNVKGRPILYHVLDIIRSMDLKKVHLLVGFGQEQVREYFGNGKDLGISISYVDVNKEHPKGSKAGLADALSVMEGYFDSPFLAMLGDEIYHGSNHREMKEAFEDQEPEAMIAVIRGAEENAIMKNYSLAVSDRGLVEKVEEKPERPWNDLLGCGTYFFRPSVFQMIKETPLSPRSGRKELTDTLNVIAEKTSSLRAFPLTGKYLNVNVAEDLKYAEEMFK